MHMMYITPFILKPKGGKNISNNKNKSTPSSDSLEIYAARLSFIGASISTLGDGLSAVAAGLTLQALEKSTKQNSQSQYTQPENLESIQKQIDYLINELKHIKKIIKWEMIGKCVD